MHNRFEQALAEADVVAKHLGISVEDVQRVLRKMREERIAEITDRNEQEVA